MKMMLSMPSTISSTSNVMNDSQISGLARNSMQDLDARVPHSITTEAHTRSLAATLRLTWPQVRTGRCHERNEATRSRGRGVPSPAYAPERAHRRTEHRPDESRRLLSQLPVEVVQSRRSEEHTSELQSPL